MEVELEGHCKFDSEGHTQEVSEKFLENPISGAVLPEDCRNHHIVLSARHRGDDVQIRERKHEKKKSIVNNVTSEGFEPPALRFGIVRATNCATKSETNNAVFC